VEADKENLKAREKEVISKIKKNRLVGKVYYGSSKTRTFEEFLADEDVNIDVIK